MHEIAGAYHSDLGNTEKANAHYDRASEHYKAMRATEAPVEFGVHKLTKGFEKK